MANTDQSEEIEVLNSIFPAEFELSSMSPVSFRLHLVPDPGGNENHEDYPASAPPALEVVIEKGLSSDQKDEIETLANRVAAENIGLPSIFTIADAIREWLLDNNIPGQDGSMYSDMLRRMQQQEAETKKQTRKAAIKAAADSEGREIAIDPEELERIRKRQAGTQVTVESFVKWKAAFDEEMRLARGENTKEVSELDVKPTGKQFFLSNKTATLSNDEEAAIEALVREMEAQAALEDTQKGTFDHAARLDEEDEDDENDEDYVYSEEDDIYDDEADDDDDDEA